jgi:uncharacterized membrane protein YdfJ with MMPL/SSD domain
VTLPAIVFAVVVSSVVIVAALWGLGVLDLSRLRSTEPSTAGLVAIPTAARRVPAYTRLTRDHFWDPRTNRLTVVYLPPRAVTPEMLGQDGQRGHRHAQRGHRIGHRIGDGRRGLARGTSRLCAAVSIWHSPSQR